MIELAKIALPTGKAWEHIMLLNDILPEYDFKEIHSIVLKSSASEAFRSIKQVAPSEISPIFHWLFLIRSLPSRFTGKPGFGFSGDKALLDQMTEGHFVMLAEESGREVVIGIVMPSTVGRSWKYPEASTRGPRNAREFARFDQPGFVRVVMNLYVEDTADGDIVKLTSETRMKAIDADARRRFARYWRLIRPGSGLIRRSWLKAMKRRAEAGPLIEA